MHISGGFGLFYNYTVCFFDKGNNVMNVFIIEHLLQINSACYFTLHTCYILHL